MTMSKFFRSATDVSSSSSTSSDSEASGDETQELEVSRLNALKDDGVTDASLTLPAHTTSGFGQQDLLLHALLEERCINQALAEHRARSTRHVTQHDSEIRLSATQIYQQLCAQLAPYGLVTAGLDSHIHEASRQHFRDGLDLLSQSVPVANAGRVNSHGGSVGRFLTDGQAESSLASNTVALRSLQIATPPSSVPRALHAVVAPHPLLEVSRYQRDFEEVGTLGRGGYGVVYHVKHRLDAVAYAVKKVPLSAARLQRIQLRGQSELNDLLLELRTLARLEHPNIVRYFSGWIEWSNTGQQSGSIATPERPGHDLSLRADAVLGAEDDRFIDSLPLSRVITQSDDDDNIMFEASCSRESAGGSSSQHVHDTIGTAGNAQATISDHEIESMSRQDEPPASGFSNSVTNDLPQASGGPILCLHMQMALYPMTLADFISPPTPTDPSVAPLKHCFHLGPSVQIMLALLDGIEYLHREGIVHRDLKPGNVFLGANSNPRSTRGSVDLMLCDQCRGQGTAKPVTLNVRIGDFGLVAAVADPDDDAIDTGPVGTAIYRPQATQTSNNSALDLYALGIMFFELLCEFDTRMERHETLQRLKSGRFPLHIARHQHSSVTDCIKFMLALDEEVAPTVDNAKKRLRSIASRG